MTNKLNVHSKLAVEKLLSGKQVLITGSSRDTLFKRIAQSEDIAGAVLMMASDCILGSRGNLII